MFTQPAVGSSSVAVKLDHCLAIQQAEAWIRYSLVNSGLIERFQLLFALQPPGTLTGMSTDPYCLSGGACLLLADLLAAR